MNWISRRICEIAEVTVSFVMSVCLSTWNNSAPSGEIYMKFDISLFFKKNIDDHFHGIFMNIAVIRFDSHICIWLERSIQKQSALSAFWIFLESLPTGFSNFHAFYCCRSDSLLPSVSQSVIQLLEYVKLSAPSNVTANLMALSLWQEHFCMLLFWTKSLVLHVMGVISCILLFAKLITLSRTLLDIIPVLQNCVWTVLCFVWSLATWTANLII